MARGRAVPTDQSLFADAPGAPTRDEAVSAPATGLKTNVTLSVTFAMDTISGNATLAYHVGGPDISLYQEVDSGATGVQTKSFALGTIDLGTITLVAKVVSPIDPSSIEVTAWSFTYDKAGLIVDTGAI